MFVFPLQLSAKTVEIDGINYYLAPNSHMAEVIPGNYSGLTSITIPEAITYDDVMYNVTTIGGTAFSGCSGLSSITIPNSVTII